MKKIILILCMIFLFVGCADNNKNENSLSEETPESLISESPENGYEILDEEQYYRVKKSDGAYSYEILDSNGNIVRTDGLYTKKPHISMLNESVVKVSYQTGTGLSTRWTFYYDTVNDEFSPEYYSVFGESNGNVVYTSGSSILISDIFDKTKYYKEINKFKCHLAKTIEPFISAEIDDNGDMIKITYLTGDDFEEITEYFDIGENDWKKAYKEVLETFKNSDDYNEYSMFSLFDINSDDIPELFISEGISRISGCHIYSYHDGLISLGKYGTCGEVAFKPNLNLISAYDLHWGYEYIFEYSFSEDSSLVLEKCFYNDMGAAESPEKREYKIDNKLVSAVEYQTELKKYHDDDTISLGYDHRFTENDISSALSEYK